MVMPLLPVTRHLKMRGGQAVFQCKSGKLFVNVENRVMDFIIGARHAFWGRGALKHVPRNVKPQPVTRSSSKKHHEKLQFIVG